MSPQVLVKDFGFSSQKCLNGGLFLLNRRESIHSFMGFIHTVSHIVSNQRLLRVSHTFLQVLWRENVELFIFVTIVRS